MADFKGKKIAYISTIPFPLLTHCREYILELVDAGADLTVITSFDSVYTAELEKITKVETVTISRNINLISDIKALFKLTLLFRKHKFDLIHSMTPKGGLLAAIAGSIANIPVKMHTFTGQVWVEKEGMFRGMLIFFDKVIAKLTTINLTDSLSQKSFLIKHKITSADKLKVLGKGSFGGVNLSRFNLDRYSDDNTSALKADLGISVANARVVTFLGRINKDKGVLELLNAFSLILDETIFLLLIGPVDDSKLLDKISQIKNTIYISQTSEPEKYLALTDVLCLPSYREGFGTVVIEAAAMKVPTVGTKIYGLTDAIIDNQTGLLVPPRSVDELLVALKTLLDNKEKRLEMGVMAHQRVVRHFDSKRLTYFLMKEYKKYLK